MTIANGTSADTSLSVVLWADHIDEAKRRQWEAFSRRAGSPAGHCGPGWSAAICSGLRHKGYVLVAMRGDNIVGLLPLVLVKSAFFGRFLVSLPYVNSAGIVAEDERAAVALIDRAVCMADQLDVRYLELRHEVAHAHPALLHQLTSKVHMRLPLPASESTLWANFTPKVRNQIRKADKLGLAVSWGREELLSDFYAVFSHNMRDLGTPVFGRRLFRYILEQLAGESELCVVRLQNQPVAAALVVHGNGRSEVPSASSLRAYNFTDANMLMYWSLMRRAIERGAQTFDFGRSTVGSNTYRFKKQWGARPDPAVWQYYVRKGTATEMRPESGKYDRMIAVWKRLPVWLTRLVGPPIVRGIP